MSGGWIGRVQGCFFRFLVWNACSGVSLWFGTWMSSSIWAPSLLPRGTLTILSDKQENRLHLFMIFDGVTLTAG